jgi:hypothetical protein
MALQGPHHGAQKSTNTGFSAFNTSASKLPSSISKTWFAIFILLFDFATGFSA